MKGELMRNTKAILILALFAVIVSACAGNATEETTTPTTEETTPTTEETTTTQGSPDRVSVTYIPLLNFAPLYVALEKGYFDEQGLEVEINITQGGSTDIGLLANGTMDARFAGMSAGTIAAIDQGIDIKLVLPLTEHPAAGEGVASAFMMRQELWDSGEVRSAEDLRGKKVALNAPGGLAEYLVEKILAKYDMTLDDIERTYIGFSEMPAALENGAVDAAFMGDPAATLVSMEGVATLLEDDSAPTPGLQSSLLWYGPEFINERTDVAKRFALAISKGVRDLAGDAIYEPENRQIITEYVNIPADIFETTLTTAVFSTDPTLDPSALIDQQEFFIRAGTLEVDEPVDPGMIIDNQFSEYVLAELGPYSPE